MKKKPGPANLKFSAAFLQGSPPECKVLETDAPSKKRAVEWAKSIADERGWRFVEVLPVCVHPNLPCPGRTGKDNLCQRHPIHCHPKVSHG